jgi:microcystin degradation protein MlrC
VLSASHFIVMPWLDVPDVGWSALVVTDGDVDLAGRYADELASTAWDLRAEFWDVQRLSPADAIRRAVEAERGPVIICDASDSVPSGAPGDGTCLLREMLRQRITCGALVPIVDPRVVDEAINAGVGSQIGTRVGGSLDPVFGAPVEVSGRVAGIAREGMRFPIGQLGFSDMGRSVLLQVGSISLVVSEFRGIGGVHPDIYHRFGVDPAEARIIVVKTYFHYEDFAPLYTDAYRADCPGLSGWDLPTFPWVHATRPIYPLDEGVEWRPERQ